MAVYRCITQVLLSHIRELWQLLVGNKAWRLLANVDDHNTVFRTEKNLDISIDDTVRNKLVQAFGDDGIRFCNEDIDDIFHKLGDRYHEPAADLGIPEDKFWHFGKVRVDATTGFSSCLVLADVAKTDGAPQARVFTLLYRAANAGGDTIHGVLHWFRAAWGGIPPPR